MDITNKELQDCQLAEDIKEDFDRSPSYQEVYKNLNYVYDSFADKIYHKICVMI